MPISGRAVRKTALVHEDPLLLGVHQLDDVGIGGQVPARPELGDLRVDRLHALPAGARHSMVAVDDEVRVPELVDDDRRKIPVRESPLHSLEPLADVRSTGSELTVEVATPAVCPDDLSERDGTKSYVTARKRA